MIIKFEGRQPFLIAGQPVYSSNADVVTAPFDGAVLGEVSLAGRSDVDRAITLASEALQRGLAP